MRAVPALAVADEPEPGVTNWVSLVGRISKPPAERVLPSGDVVVGFRVTVPRVEPPLRPRAPRSDWFDCAAWNGRVRRTASRWREGDLVEVEGPLRRRVYRSDAGFSSVVEVEVRVARRVRRTLQAQS